MNCFAELFCGQWWSNGNAGAPQKAALPKIKSRTAAKRWIVPHWSKKKVGKRELAVTFATGGARTCAGRALKGPPER